MEELKKFTKTYDISNYEILTDTGFEPINKLHETIEYDVWQLKTKSGKILKCADNHIVFSPFKGIKPVSLDIVNGMVEVFVKDLKVDDKIIINSNVIDYVESVEKLNYKEKMFDFELFDGNRRYFTNEILSHNTETAKAISEEIFGPNTLIRIDMSEYSEKMTASRLTGSAPGYVGYDDGGQLTEAVRKKPYSVVLFDEIEKAHPDIFNILLQILDEGRLTDNAGRTVNFKNTIIIMTSNVGVKLSQQIGKGIGFGLDKIDENVAIKDNINKEVKKIFAPEFLNRINDIITFNQLTKDDMKGIVDLQLNILKNRIKAAGFILSWDANVIEYIAENTYEPEFGARPIERGIQTMVEDLIADEILRNNIQHGAKIKIKKLKNNEQLTIDIKN
jgi:ATP-dependent Clp protease ATP-binding subunit ClpC